MKNDNIVLEAGFSLHQQVLLVGLSLPPLFFSYNLLNWELNWKGHVVFLLSSLLFIVLLSLAFSKKGLVQKRGNLYKGYFFKGLLLYRRRIHLKDRPVVSILKFKKRQKLAFISAANPDYSESFNSFEVFVLNATHYKRDAVIFLQNEENAQKAADFLTRNFPLRQEVFSPGYVG